MNVFNKPVKADNVINIAEAKITPAMKKQFVKAHRDEYKPYSVSVKVMCQKVERPEYFIQIKNRILRELEENSDLGDYIIFDLADLQDIRLTVDGVFIFFEILTSYFDEKDVRELFILMRQMEEGNKAAFELQQSLSGMTKKDLKDFIKQYSAYVPEKGMEEAKQILLVRARAELKKRRGLFA